jgi:hypothetical protein
MVLLDYSFWSAASHSAIAGAKWRASHYQFFSTILGADIIISLFALSKTHHRGLGRYTPTLWLYFHLGTLAAFKAGYEMIFSPYFWDKTTHGHSLKSVKTTPMQPPVSQSLTE